MQTRRVVRGATAGRAKIEAARALRRRMTPAEALLWERLRDGRLAGLHIRRQQVVSGFIADFYCAAAGLVIEVDGSVHDGQREADQARDDALAARDIVTLRVSSDDVEREIGAVLRRILTAAQPRLIASPAPAEGQWDADGAPVLATAAPQSSTIPSPFRERGQGVR